MDFDLTEFHNLINEVLAPRYQTSADLWRGKCGRLLEHLNFATRYVKSELDRYQGEPKEQSIRHTLDNTNLEQLPSDDDETERGETIHYEK